MFRCAKDGHVTRPGEMRIPVVTEVRSVVYNTVQAFRDKKSGEEDEITMHSSRGTEVVREEGYCPSHARSAAQAGPVVLDEEPKEIRLMS